MKNKRNKSIIQVDGAYEHINDQSSKDKYIFKTFKQHLRYPPNAHTHTHTQTQAYITLRYHFRIAQFSALTINKLRVFSFRRRYFIPKNYTNLNLLIIKKHQFYKPDNAKNTCTSSKNYI